MIMDEELDEYVAEKKESFFEKNKKYILFIACLFLLIIVLFGLMSINERSKSSFQETKYKGIYNHNGKISISVENITDGKTRYESPIRSDIERLIFSIKGQYKGNLFSGYYIKTEGKKKSTIIMQVTPELDPKNKIIDGYIVPKLDRKNKRIIFDIYVDEDWKNEIGDTYIVWTVVNGENVSLETKKFSYKEILPGIYKDTVTSNSFYNKMEECNQNDGYCAHEGNLLLVGNPTPEDLSKPFSPKKNTYTFMKII